MQCIMAVACNMAAYRLGENGRKLKVSHFAWEDPMFYVDYQGWLKQEGVQEGATAPPPTPHTQFLKTLKSALLS